MNKTFAWIRYIMYFFVASLGGEVFTRIIPGTTKFEGIMILLLSAILWEVLDWKYTVETDKGDEA